MKCPTALTRRTLVVLACSLCLTLVVGPAAAQPVGRPAPMAPGSFTPDVLVGDWTIPFPNEGGPPMTGTVAYRPDGSYEETLVIGGEPVGWWRGRYTLAPDGTLTLDETETSPQLCYAGQCQPNDPPTRTVTQLVNVGPSSYSATFVDETGVPATLTFTRASARAAPGFGAQPGGMVPVTPVPATPMDPGAAGPNPAGPSGPGPAAPNPLAPNPLAPAPAVPGPGAGPAEDPWVGTWTDGEVTVRIGGEEGAVLEVGGAVYPMSASGDDTRLVGTFESLEARYDIVLERTPEGMAVTSGGSTYTLRSVGDAPPATSSGNPLGD